MPAALSEIVHRFRGRRVLLIGDLILDRYVYGDAERISPEAPVPVLRIVERRHAVGGSANVAACLRALGCQVLVCGVIGEDRNGGTLRTLLSDIGLDTEGVVVSPTRPTTTKTRMVGLAQHRHRQQLLRVDDEDRSPLPAAERDRVVSAAVERMEQVDVVCIEDYDKGVVTDGTAATVIRAATDAGKPVLVDPARISDYARYRGATVLTPNRDELGHAVGASLGSVASVGEAGVRLIPAVDVTAIVATVDRDGSVVVRDGRWVHVPTRPRSVYDNTGAGDAVLAALAASVAAGAGLEDSARLANICGGLEVEKFGCVPISAEEVLAELQLESQRRNGKLRGIEELSAELTLRRDRGETVAFTNGCFDIVHAGHVDFLRRCREQASVLVVGLNSDESIRGQGKGDDRPINRFEHRCAVLSEMSSVDYVVGFDAPTPEALIRQVRPDVLVKGEDWAGRGVVGADFVKSCGGRVVLLPLVEGLSTSALIERIRGGGASV
ncbi:MAG: bifunctional heptose 7-phosphate kinase/heptose 1-phosphate adenyltransferase [Phycisphaerales bacterium]|nr:MAG: bifunctional heptose 7-phosphate kinase/heptose 1-phosphate adenyltransferase [Phycisphaerales bacterium]